MTTWHNKLNAELAGRVSALEMAVDGLILAYGSDDEARELNEILQILRRGAAGGEQPEFQEARQQTLERIRSTIQLRLPVPE